MGLNLEVSFCTAGERQPIAAPDNASGQWLPGAGFAPFSAPDRPRDEVPTLRFPRAQVRKALEHLARVTPLGTPVRLAGVNPVTECECMPTLGLLALMPWPGKEMSLSRRSASAILRVVEGALAAFIDETRHALEPAVTLAFPRRADMVLANASAR